MPWKPLQQSSRTGKHTVANSPSIRPKPMSLIWLIACGRPFPDCSLQDDKAALLRFSIAVFGQLSGLLPSCISCENPSGYGARLSAIDIQLCCCSRCGLQLSRADERSPGQSTQYVPGRRGGRNPGNSARTWFIWFLPPVSAPGASGLVGLVAIDSLSVFFDLAEHGF